MVILCAIYSMFHVKQSSNFKLAYVLCGILSTILANMCFAYYVPNAYSFKCPHQQTVDTAKNIQISVGEIPRSIGDCYFKPIGTAFELSPDLHSVYGTTIWQLDGPYLSSGCSSLEGEFQITPGVITMVSCSTK